MFKNLIKVIISIKEYNNSLIIIDNDKKDISLNEKYNNFSIKEFNDFVNTFFRIIREWQNEKYVVNKNIIISIRIIEKDNQYDLHIDHQLPNNFDSFLDLIQKLHIKNIL